MNVLDDIKGLKGLSFEIREKASELRRFRSWLTVSTDLLAGMLRHTHMYLPDDEPNGTHAHIGSISFLSYHIYAQYSR